MRACSRILLGAIVAIGFVLALSSQAEAQTPQLGDPKTGDVSPHGGFSSTSNKCRQCHAIHGTQTEYALMWQDSVTATCNTCHALFGSGGTTPRDVSAGGNSQQISGTTSQRAAYIVTGDDLQGGHAIGAAEVPIDTGVVLTETDSGKSVATVPATTPAPEEASGVAVGGLYCGSCHSPHGDKGQIVNKWTSPADEGKPVYLGHYTGVKYLHYNAGVWQRCDNADGTGNCVNAVTNSNRGEANTYLYGYKLLSGNPNHTWGQGEPYTDTNANGKWDTGEPFEDLDSEPVEEGGPGGDGVYDRLKTYLSGWHDTPRWCGTCHETPAGGSATHFHNTSTGCTACHTKPDSGVVLEPYTDSNANGVYDSGEPFFDRNGNGTREDTTTESAKNDFPHTSQLPTLLKNYGDAICLSCHTGGLP